MEELLHHLHFRNCLLEDTFGLYTDHYLRDIQRQEGEVSALGPVITAGDLVDQLSGQLSLPQGNMCLMLQDFLVGGPGFFMTLLSLTFAPSHQFFIIPGNSQAQSVGLIPYVLCFHWPGSSDCC